MTLWLVRRLEYCGTLVSVSLLYPTKLNLNNIKKFVSWSD